MAEQQVEKHIPTCSETLGSRRPGLATVLLIPCPLLFALLWFGLGMGEGWLFLVVEIILAAIVFNSSLSWLLAGPAVFLLCLAAPFPESISPAGQAVAATAILMAVWWLSEAIPLGATALAPIVLFPVLGVRTTAEVMPSYAHWIVYLILGGFMLAAGMQRWNLHKRLALWLINLIGVTPSRIILGFMVASAFISMWVTNTATTVMMLPVALAVVEHLRRSAGEKAVAGFGPALMLGIAYSSSIGGTGTVVGTGPNGVLIAQAFELFDQRIDFVTWMRLGVPLVCLLIPITWLYLTRVTFKLPKPTTAAGEVIERERRALGPISRGEWSVAVIFGFTALLWLTRRTIHLGAFTIPGFEEILPKTPTGQSYINDATVAILGALLMFAVPVNVKKGEFVLDVRTALRVPWDVLLIMGGGIALAGGFGYSGLSTWVANQALVLHGVHPAFIVLMVALVMTFLTELTSNTATSTIFIPILASAAIGLGQNPYLFMLPCCFAVSMAFMLPVATPPNAIVYGSGFVGAKDMARTGFGLNLIAIAGITLMMLFYMRSVLGIEFDQVPDWATAIKP